MAAAINTTGAYSSREARYTRSPSAVVAGAVVAYWLFLGLYDTGFAAGIPMKSAARFGGVAGLAILSWWIGRWNSGIRSCPGLVPSLTMAALVALLSSFLGKSPELGLLKLALYGLALYPLFFYSFFSEFLRDSRRGRRMVFATACVLVLVGIYRGFRPAAVELGNTNWISALSVCALPIFLVEYSRRSPVFPRQGVVLAIVAAVGVCILNHSRGALGGTLACLVVWWGLQRKPRMSTAVAGFALCLVAIVVLVALSDSAENFAFKGDNTLLDDVRKNELSMCLEAAEERPLLGYGFGLSWRVEQSHWDDVLRTGRLSWYVGEFGNSVLAIVIGGGLLLLGAIAWLFASMLSYAFRMLQYSFPTRHLDEEYGILVGLVSGVLGLAVHAQAEGWALSPVTMPTFTFWMYAGAVVQVSAWIHWKAVRRQSAAHSVRY